MGEDVRLTRLAKCAGCGAKVGAGTLVKLLKDLPVKNDPALIVGFDTSDDACVYKIDDHTAVIQTLDFFPPIVDDPRMFGQIAACNALSDIYAMGGEPKLALNIMTVTKDMSEETIREILRGGYEKAYEADTIICGGHTIHDESPKYGLSVTGFADPANILKNSTARPGDVLILTKPLGIGILTTASKAGLVDKAVTERITAQMATLNRASRDNMVKYEIHSCTDVTGFSLMGHSYEMAAGSGTTLHIKADSVKYHPEALEPAQMGFIPDGAYKNRDYVGDHYATKKPVDRSLLDIFFDPQTSGGLLISAAQKDADSLLADLLYHTDAAIIGYVTEKQGTELIIE
ncbi:MAG: selenide, water dikinase SelD [Lachnospiraceae bacterium]|nr:selenide, water dikinase SelD [Lachnospiraceae bacterium]MBR5733679.1 selenide, water dikinase SelD [Lachnospiraceae bacterium]